MLNKLKKSDSKGFTIIEVMIVLAIAGLIILIVLLAVPALQRNARNTAMKADVSAIAGAIATFESDNDGAVPAAAASDFALTGPSLLIGKTGTSQATAKVQAADVIPTPVTAKPGTAITPGTIVIVKGLTCTGGASSRAFSIWYSIESSTTPTSAPYNNKCVDA